MCQLPSIRKCVRRVRSSASRMSRCLPRGTTSRTVAPVRSTAASWGTRSSPRRSVAPARAACIRLAASQTVSPSGTPPVSPARYRLAVRPPTAGMTRRSLGAEGTMAVTTLLRARLTRPEVAGRVPEPVTVTVARVVRPHRRQAFERWAADALALAATYPGNLGGTLLKPGLGSSEYHLVYRFKDDASLAAWEGSPERRAALERMQEMVDEERYARVAGLDS